MIKKITSLLFLVLSTKLLFAQKLQAKSTVFHSQNLKGEKKINNTSEIPKLFRNIYYDSVLHLKYVFIDIKNPPADKEIIEYGHKNMFFLADSNTLNIFIPNQNPEIIKEIGYDYKSVAIDLYQVKVKQNIIKDLNFIRGVLKNAHVEFNYLTYFEGCEWFNDPKFSWSNPGNNIYVSTESYLHDSDARYYILDPSNGMPLSALNKIYSDDIDSVASWEPYHKPQAILLHIIDGGIEDTSQEVYGGYPSWNYNYNNNSVVPNYHGMGVQFTSSAKNNNGFGGASSWGFSRDSTKNHDVSAGLPSGLVSGQGIYNALDSIYAYSQANPTKHNIINGSWGMGANPPFIAKVSSLINANGGNKNYMVMASGNASIDITGPAHNYGADYNFAWSWSSDIIAVGGIDHDTSMGYWSAGGNFGDSLDFVKDYCNGAAVLNPGGTWISFCGTSGASPMFSATLAQLISSDTGATRAQIWHRLKKSCFTNDTQANYTHTRQFGWGWPQLGRALKFMVVENVPLNINCSNNSAYTYSFTPYKYNDSTFFKNPKCFYPNGTQVTSVIFNGNVSTFNYIINTSNGFVNGNSNSNRIHYQFTTANGCLTDIYSEPINISNIAGPPPPVMPQITNVFNFTPPFCESDTVKIKLLNPNPSYTVTANINGTTLVYNASDSTITINGGFTAPTSHLQVNYTNNINTTPLDSFFTVKPVYNPSMAMNPQVYSLCKNTTTTFTSMLYNNVGNGTFHYQWYVDNIVQVGDTNTTFTYNFPNAGNHIISWTVTVTNSGSGCYTSNQYTDSRTINVMSLSGLAINMTPASGQICAGGSALLNATGAVSYSWTGGITNNVTFYPTATNTYTVTITGSNGCTQTSTRTISVNSTPSLNITSTPTNATVCSGQQVTLNATGATTYSWTGGITNNVAFTPTTTTTYSVTGSNGCTATATKLVTVNASPTLTIVATPTNATICSGQSVILNATGANTYSWTGGIINNSSFTPTTTTTYTVTGTSTNGCSKTSTKTVLVNSTSSSILNATICQGQNYLGYTTAGVHIDTFINSNGCDSMRTINLTVNTLPTINITSSPTNAIVCAGQSVTLNATGTSPIWSGGISNNSSFVPTATTTYTVTATGTNGCTNTNIKTVTVNPLPIINITATPSNATVCSGQSAILNATGASTYSWSGGISNNVSFVPTATNTYTVTATASNSCTSTATKTVTVGTNTTSTISVSICQGQNYLGYNTTGIHVDTLVNANGCDSIRTINLTVHNLPTVTVNSNPVNTNLCAGQSITLNGNGANTYSWSGGINNAVNFIPTATNTYTITGTDINNCSNTASVTVSVTPYPIINIAVSPNDTLCAGDNVLLNATSTNATITWNGGVTNNSTFVPVATSNYIVTATSNANNLCSSTASQHIEVKPNINPTITVTSSTTQGVTGAPVVYTATTNVPLTYSLNWYLNSVYQTNTTTNSWSTNLAAGTNNVYATIKSTTQCLQPDSATSNIAKVNNITAINDIQIEGISVYPNPFTDFISIEGLHPKDEIELYNNIGQKLLETSGQNIVNNMNQIELTSYASGLLILHITREDKTNIIKLTK
ncbi:MAG: hypothetical protein KBG11_09215 [Bacteroidia bacterium]|nr:hypothetical protein [Bacteroidia bacterium]